MRTQARYSKRGPTHPHANPRFGVWATAPTREIENPRAECQSWRIAIGLGFWAGFQVRVPTRIRIGNEHADR